MIWTVGYNFDSKFIFSHPLSLITTHFISQAIPILSHITIHIYFPLFFFSILVKLISVHISYSNSAHPPILLYLTYYFSILSTLNFENRYDHMFPFLFFLKIYYCVLYFDRHSNQCLFSNNINI